MKGMMIVMTETKTYIKKVQFIMYFLEQQTTKMPTCKTEELRGTDLVL